jgi:hypothetical protein
MSVPHSAVITQLTLSSVTLCYWFSKVHCLHVLCNENVINHLFYDSKKSLHCNKQKLQRLLCLLRVFHILLLVFHTLFKPISISQWKWILMFMRFSSVPLNHEHQDSTKHPLINILQNLTASLICITNITHQMIDILSINIYYSAAFLKIIKNFNIFKL